MKVYARLSSNQCVTVSANSMLHPVAKIVFEEVV